MTTVTIDRSLVDRTVERHRELLDRAVRANRERTWFSAFPESPSPRVYGESAAADGQAAFEGLLHRRFDLGQPGTTGWVATERSPWGPELGVEYPHAGRRRSCSPPSEPRSARGATPARSPAPRCASRCSRGSTPRASRSRNAVMHTSGQAFVMAFQAGGPHAQDRALEAVAFAYEEQTRTPRRPSGRSRRASDRRCG